ncbi:MAG TPA: sigma-54 dependent transcriptional regulator [Bryobacterales bacterium]|jgi:two-component system response regulator AtoC|nr:sigma-54 dependent transcriptional regulator [Bryobacterales bacterium]
MNRRRVLVVDDDKSILAYLSDLLADRYDVDCLDSGEGVVPYLGSGARPSLILLDLMMPAVSGLDVLAAIERLSRRPPVIVLSAIGQINTVVRAMKLGASDYLVKPVEEQDLYQAIENALEESDDPEETAAPAAACGADIISANRQVLRVKQIAAQVADAEVPVLLLGESGVGKDVFARYIHARSSRSAAPFVKVNCAALPADLLESELFGYDRGAFTGALREKPGKFELAGRGTLFLDEIGEMSPVLQAKLLHVLQDGEYSRLGSTRSTLSQARIIASTNKRIEEAVSKGEFREDLYFRLNVIRLQIPPLRERREDILPLSHFFLEKYRPQYPRSPRQLPRELIQAILLHSWPGNVRQLENTIKRFLVLPDLDFALAELRESGTPFNVSSPPQNRSLKRVSALAAERAEKEVVLRTLDETNWNRKQAARELNICYKALLNKLRKWDIPGRSKGPIEPSAL